MAGKLSFKVNIEKQQYFYSLDIENGYIQDLNM